MTQQLREELDALAHTQTFSPDASTWDRGRRARRRDRIVRGVAALAVVAAVAGAGALAVRQDPIAPAGEVRGGAIPSRITTPEDPTLREPDLGQASVAFVVAGGTPVLVDATTGEAHAVELPDFPTPEVLDRGAEHRRGPWLALSPDGRRLAYPTTQDYEREPGQVFNQTSWYRVVDLTTGASDLVDLPPYGSTPLAMSWTADGRIAVDVFGRPTRQTSATNPPPTISWTIDPGSGDSSSSPLTGVIAPGKGISAPFPIEDETVRAVRFETATGTDPVRELPTDLYPDGATVSPIGWADNSLLVAEVDDDLVLLTSPDRPESEWTWRIMVRDLPDALGLVVATDLVPELDGTSSQQLTRDFGDTSGSDDAPGVLPDLLGVLMALLAGLAFVWMMIRRA